MQICVFLTILRYSYTTGTTRDSNSLKFAEYFPKWEPKLRAELASFASKVYREWNMLLDTYCLTIA